MTIRARTHTGTHRGSLTDPSAAVRRFAARSQAPLNASPLVAAPRQATKRQLATAEYDKAKAVNRAYRIHRRVM